MAIPTDAEKEFDNIQHIHDKNTQKTRNKREFFQLEKSIYKNSTAKIILNGKN